MIFATNQKMLLYSGVSCSCICLFMYFFGRGMWSGPGLGDWIRGLSYDRYGAAVEAEAAATGRALARTTAAPRSRNAARITRGGAGTKEWQRTSRRHSQTDGGQRRQRQFFLLFSLLLTFGMAAGGKKGNCRVQMCNYTTRLRRSDKFNPRLSC